MADKRVKRQVWLLALTVLVFVLATPACGRTVSPTSVATPRPTGKVDTGMGGTLSIQGVVTDAFGNVAPDAYVAVTAFEEGVYWDRTGSDYRQLGAWDLYTDETGSYSFNNLKLVEGGHYQVWFNSGQEYGQVYESSGYYIIKETDDDAHLLSEGHSDSYFSYSHDESGDVYLLNVTVHPVTGSALSGAIWYRDADGATKNYFASPLGSDHRIELNRGSGPDSHEYTVGVFTSDGSKGTVDGLAGGTYYLIFQYIGSDGLGVECTSSSIKVPPGETKQIDYTIPESSCNIVQ